MSRQTFLLNTIILFFKSCSQKHLPMCLCFMLDLNVPLQLIMCSSKHATCITVEYWSSQCSFSGLFNSPDGLKESWQLSHSSFPFLIHRWGLVISQVNRPSCLICITQIQMLTSYWVFFSYMLSELFFLFKSFPTSITELENRGKRRP